MYYCLSFGNSFSGEASNNLAQPMKVNTFKMALVEAFSNRFPRRTTAHQCAQMSVSVSTQCGRGNQEPSSQTAQCVSQEFLMNLFPGLLNDQLEVRQGGKRLIGVLMVIADLFQNSTKDRMLDPTRDSLDSVAMAQRFLYNNPDCHVFTRYGPLTKTVSNMDIAEEVSRLCHGHINERSVNSG